MKRNNEVYRDEQFVLMWQDDLPYLKTNSEIFKLTCHPYEPCLYITGEDGRLTTVHNAFDPSHVLCAFSDGMIITSITGREYDAKDFCQMVEYAAGMGNITISDAEKIFEGREKKKHTEAEKQAEKEKQVILQNNPDDMTGSIITDKHVETVISEYPDSVIDFCLVKTERAANRQSAHWYALFLACRNLFIDECDEEVIWDFDAKKAVARPVSVDELFAPLNDNGKLNYRKAFLKPPHTNNYGDTDFDKINKALFPNGTDGLEIYEWTTDWSEYFDEGREWWGTLCLTVYDIKLDRYVVIMASATD